MLENGRLILCDFLAMAQKQITVEKAARILPELVGRLYYQGGSVLLTEGGKPMATMSGIRRGKTGAELALVWSKMARLGVKEAGNFEKDLRSSRKGLRIPSTNWD
jgi:antitoxin (DNA-binding transcriptional repressor) of toxin-antitoxin stability system